MNVILSKPAVVNFRPLMDRSTRPETHAGKTMYHSTTRRPSRRAKQRAAAILVLIMAAWVCIAVYLIRNPFVIWDRQIVSNEEEDQL